MATELERRRKHHEDARRQKALKKKMIKQLHSMGYTISEISDGLTIPESTVLEFVTEDNSDIEIIHHMAKMLSQEILDDGFIVLKEN